MAKFKFKYETIKRVKENQENRIKNMMMELEIKIKTIEEEKKRRLEELNKQKLEMSGVVSASEIKFYKDFEKFTYNSIKTLDNEIEEIEKDKAKVLKALSEKRKECLIFEKLKDKHINAFKYQENKQELEMMNEIAIRKFSGSKAK